MKSGFYLMELLLSLIADQNHEIEQIGKGVLERKEVAVVTLAGGVGSRLGYSGPKGTFQLEVDGKSSSLFQRQKEKIGDIPWIVMVSPATKDQTVQHFQESVLAPGESVFLVVQEEVEALGMNREVLKDERGLPIKLPNGNGSLFSVLQRRAHLLLTKSEMKEAPSSVLEVLRNQSIKYVNIVSIDNVLVKIADPRMLGWIEKTHSNVVSAAIPIKRGKLGVFIKEEGKVSICEYTDTPSGEILLSSDNSPLGNIANHVVALSFLISMDSSYLRYHDACKKIPHAGDKHPDEPNGIKRELFIFDGFNLSDSHSVVEYDGSSYEGLKNKDGEEDSISSCIEALKNK